ncbi:MAG: N BRCA1 IG protein [Anaerolineales bacterium]|nr:N BRCA1 IG protein [Anaerolineales bacterium]
MIRPATTPRWISVTILAAILVGCGPATGTVGPQVWIDAPLHDSRHPVAPMEIVLHAGHPDGVAMIEVAVNGEVLSRRPPDNSKGPLVTFRADWDPQSPGEYLLAARAQDHSGAWGEATVNKVILTGAVPRASVVTPTTTPTASASPPSTPACVDRAEFVTDVTFPDNQIVAPGAAFQKIWRLRNDGSCPWTERYQVVFVDGDSMNNNSPRPMPQIVQPGETVDLAVDMVAPSADGTYRGSYLLRNPQGQTFGLGRDGQTPFYVQIIVGQRRVITPTLPPAVVDTQAPSVSVSHSPAGSSLPTGTSITFTATASDNVGVTRIDIWVTAPGQFPVLAKTCNNTTSCSTTGGPYNSMGTLSYFAIAADAAGHETNSGGQSITIYVVISQRLRFPS